VTLDGITVIVVSYGHAAHLPGLLASLNSIEDCVSKVFVVDNLGDLSPGDLCERSKLSVELIPTATNEGYAGGANLAAARASTDQLLFLSPDAEVVEFDGERLLTEIEESEVGAIGALTIDPETGDTLVSWGEFPGTRRLLSRFLGTRCRREQSRLDDLVAARSVDVDWLVGAAVLIRRGVFEAVGGFDPRYRAAGEDQDFGYRLLRHGFRCRVSPGWRVRHRTRDPDSIRHLIRRNDWMWLRDHGRGLDRRLVAWLYYRPGYRD